MMSIRTASVVVLLLGTARSAAAQGHSRDRAHKGDHDSNHQQGNRVGQGGEHDAVVPQQVQRQRAKVQQQRAAEYRRQLDQQLLATQQQNLQLQQQRRMAQYRVHQLYSAQLRQQHQALLAPRDYATDPYVSAPDVYRYVANGANRLTNQYGADVLRQAVRNGFAQGYRAGEADKQDRSPSSYQSTFAYRDANYGYAGRDVDQSDYNFYFRQALQRGYDDGFTHRAQYGSTTNGTSTILNSLLSAILVLQPTR